MKLTNPYNLTICYINIMKLLNSYVRLALWVEHQLRSVMVVGSNLTWDNIFFIVISMLSLCRLYVVSMSSHALKLTRTTRLKLSHHILVNSIVVMILAREARVRVRVEEAHIVENFFFLMLIILAFQFHFLLLLGN